MTEKEVATPAETTPVALPPSEAVFRDNYHTPEARAEAAAILQWYIERQEAAGGLQALLGLCSDGDETDEEVERALEELS